MSVPKRHHWVPQFYLKHFKTPESKEGSEQIWAFHRKSGDPFLTAVKNIVAETHLYTHRTDQNEPDTKTETELSSLEHTLSLLWPDLAHGFVDLSNESIRKGLGLFLAVQLMRHPRQRDQMQQTHDRMIDFIKKSNGGSLPPTVDFIVPDTSTDDGERIETVDLTPSDETFDNRTWLDHIRFDAIECAEMLMKKRWSVVFIEDPLFITSDNPLYVPDPELNKDQVGHPDAKIFFPLSPTRILCMDTLNQPANQYYPLPSGESDMYNATTWVNADQFMISSQPTYDVLVGIDRFHTKARQAMREEALKLEEKVRYPYKKRKKRSR